MRKKSPVPLLLASKRRPQDSAVKRDARTKDLFFHARSFHHRCEKLAGTLEFGSSPFAEFDVFPVIFLCRHALELEFESHRAW